MPVDREPEAQSPVSSNGPGSFLLAEVGEQLVTVSMERSGRGGRGCSCWGPSI